MDIYGKKARQTDGVEEFKVGGGAGTVENPDQVLERESETLSEDSNGEFSKSPIHEVSSYDEMLSVKSEGKVITKEFQEEYNEEEMFEASLEPMDSSRKLFRHIITTI